MQKFKESIELFRCHDTNVLPPIYSSQCMSNSYNTLPIKMLYFHDSFQYIQKSATYAAKSFHFQLYLSLLGSFHCQRIPTLPVHTGAFPVSYLSKIVERVVTTLLMPPYYLFSNQPIVRPFHSTETAVLCVHNSDGSVSLFEVGIGFTVFLKVGPVLCLGISKYCDISKGIFPRLHYFNSVHSLYAGIGPIL